MFRSKANVSAFKSLTTQTIVWIQLVKDGKMIGFKFVIPLNFPNVSPTTYLDEPINPQVIEFIDYVEDHNVLQFEYLSKWNKAKGIPNQSYNLQQLLI